MASKDPKPRRITLRFSNEDYEAMDRKRFEEGKKKWQKLAEEILLDGLLKGKVPKGTAEPSANERAQILLELILRSGVKRLVDAILSDLEAFATSAEIVRQKLGDHEQFGLPEDLHELRRRLDRLRDS